MHAFVWPCLATSHFLLVGVLLVCSNVPCTALAANQQQENAWGEVDQEASSVRNEVHERGSFSSASAGMQKCALNGLQGDDLMSLLDKLSSFVEPRPQFVGLGWDAGDSLAEEMNLQLFECDSLWRGSIDDTYEMCIRSHGAAELAALFQQKADGKYTDLLVHGTLYSMLKRVRSQEDGHQSSPGSHARRLSNPWGAMVGLLEDFLNSTLAKDIDIKASEARALKLSRAVLEKPYGNPWLFDQKALNAETWYQELLCLIGQADGPGLAFHLEQQQHYGFSTFYAFVPHTSMYWMCTSFLHASHLDSLNVCCMSFKAYHTTCIGPPQHLDMHASLAFYLLAVCHQEALPYAPCFGSPHQQARYELLTLCRHTPQ